MSVRLPKTEAAIAAYDREYSRPDPDYGLVDRLAEAVGQAFGEETSDRNDPETCRACIRPGNPLPAGHPDESFVRRMVRKWREDDQEITNR